MYGSDATCPAPPEPFAAGSYGVRDHAPEGGDHIRGRGEVPTWLSPCDTLRPPTCHPSVTTHTYIKFTLWATTLNRAPQVVRDLAARHHAEVLLPHGAHGIERGAEQSLCARAKSALESTGATMIICDLPIEVVEVSVCSSCMGRVQIAPGGQIRTYIGAMGGEGEAEGRGAAPARSCWPRV